MNNDTRAMLLESGINPKHKAFVYLGVLAEIAPTHIAGLPVAINIQCHCMRCEKCVL